MDAAERQARLAQAAHVIDDVEFEPALEAQRIDLSERRSVRDLSLLVGIGLVRFTLFALIYMGLSIWLDLHENRERSTDFWDYITRWHTLVELAVAAIAALSFMIPSPFRRKSRSIGPRRAAAIVIDLRPDSLLSPGDAVVLEERDGEQTVYHAQAAQFDSIEPGTAGVALILHHRLLAFHPLAA